MSAQRPHKPLGGPEMARYMNGIILLFGSGKCVWGVVVFVVWLVDSICPLGT